MNKKFLSLALVAAFSISFSVVASDKAEVKDEKKVEVKVSDVPEFAKALETNLSTDLDNAKKALEQAEKDLTAANKNKDENKDTKDLELAKELATIVENCAKQVSELKAKIAFFQGATKAVSNYNDATYNKSLMNKVTSPVRYVANLIANNNKVALALEVTGVAGLSYVIYKSFFAQEEEDEDSL